MTSSESNFDDVHRAATMVDEEHGYAFALGSDTMELQHLRRDPSRSPSPDTVVEMAPRRRNDTLPHMAYDYAAPRAQAFWDRFRGKTRRKVSWRESGWNILTMSCECLHIFVECRCSRMRCTRPECSPCSNSLCVGCPFYGAVGPDTRASIRL